MPTPSLPETCAKCPGWHAKLGGGFGYCPATGQQTQRGHECDAPIPDDLPQLEAYERRRWEAQA